MKKRTVGLILCGGIIAVAAMVILAVSFMHPTIIKNHHLVYLKDGELYLNMFNIQGGFAITEGLSGKYEDAMVYAHKDKELAELTTFCKDGEIVFYPNHMTQDNMFDLYRRSTNKLDEAGEKIVGRVISYQVSPNGDSLVYHTNNGLFWTDFDETIQFSEHIWDYWVSKDGNIVYWTNGAGVNRWEKGKEKKYISRYAKVLLISEDFSTVYYDPGNRSICASVDGQDGECLFEEAACLQVFDDGTMYFVMEERDFIPMSDYVIDDYLETDKDTSGMTAEQLKEKEKRDAMRQEIAGYTRVLERCALYYFNGRKSIKVADNVVNAGYPFLTNEYTYVAAGGDDAAAICVDIEIFKGYETVLLSEIENVTETYLEWVTTYDTEIETRVIAGEKIQTFDKEFESKRMFSKNGKKLYLLNEDKATLYEIDLTKEQWELKEYDTNLYTEPEAIVLLEDGIMYYKDVATHEGVWDKYGTLCVNQYEVASDVFYSRYEMDAQESIYFLVDYYDSTGTLCYYKDGKVTEIDHKVYILDFKVAENGGIFYMKDYDGKAQKGNLCYSENGEAGKVIVKDAVGIVNP